MTEFPLTNPVSVRYSYLNNLNQVEYKYIQSYVVDGKEYSAVAISPDQAYEMMKQWYNSSKIAAKIKADYELPEKDRVEYEPQSGFGKRMNKAFFKIVLNKKQSALQPQELGKTGDKNIKLECRMINGGKKCKKIKTHKKNTKKHKKTQKKHKKNTTNKKSKQ